MKSIKNVGMKIGLAAVVCISGLSVLAKGNPFRKENKYPLPMEAYNRDCHGEGKVIAIIDSGADVTHEAFLLSDESHAKLSEEDVNRLIAENGLKGKYVSAKIPYVYDYFHDDTNIKSYSEHGMHVAGIAGANGDVFKGVANESQLLLMKVFPDEGLNFTFENAELYIQAMKDAIVLGADVINLSLGTGAGTTLFVNPEMVAVCDQCEELGIAVNIACGNNGYYGFGLAKPRSENPDYGVIAMPAILPNVTAVASMDGDFVSETMVFAGEKRFAYKHCYQDRHCLATPLQYGHEYELVDCGSGEDEYFPEDLDLRGKIAICKRGKFTFRQLQAKASHALAAGIIIYNNEDNTDELVQLDGSEFGVSAVTMKY